MKSLQEGGFMHAKDEVKLIRSTVVLCSVARLRAASSNFTLRKSSANAKPSASRVIVDFSKISALRSLGTWFLLKISPLSSSPADVCRVIK